MRGPAKLFLKPNLNTEGAISIVTVSNRVFTTRPLGIFWYNAQSGQAELVAPIQDCVGELIPPNQVVWKSAFGPIADLRLTYTKSAIESDLVLLQQPQLPAGWDPATTRLELWHDWAGAPTPAFKSRVLYSEPDARLRQKMLEPDLTDQILDFGDLWFPTGAGFATDGKPDLAPNEPRPVVVRNLTADPSLIGVGKTWLTTPFMSVLAEGLRWPDIQKQFAGLPLAAAPAADAGQPLDRSGWLAQLPPPNADAGGKEKIGVATGEYHPAAFVLDYTTVPNFCSTNYPFNSGETYYVGTPTYFSSVVTFYPGCTVKLTNGTYLLVCGAINCAGTAANPSVLTSYTDGLFGVSMAPNSDSCAGLAPAVALWDYFINRDLTIAHMRFRWAQTALRFDSIACGANTHSVIGCTFEECPTGIQSSGPNVSIGSSSRSGVTTPTLTVGCGTFSGSLTDIGTVDSDGNGLADSVDYKYFGRCGSLPAHVVGQMMARTNGHSPSTAKVIWSTRNDATTNYVYNTNCWLHGVTGLTAFSPWRHNDVTNFCCWGGGTLITPQHAITVHHMSSAFPSNELVRFVGRDGITYERRVRGSWDLLTNNLDHYSVMVFDQPLPATVEHVRLLPSQAPHKRTFTSEGRTCYSREMPIVGFNQFKEAFVAGNYGFTYPSFYFPEADISHSSVWFPDWVSGCDTGDSGSPVFVLINNELVLVGPWSHCTIGVPWTGDLINTLNWVIGCLDVNCLHGWTDFTASTYPLSDFPDLW